MRPLRRLKQPLLTAVCAVLSLVLRPWSGAVPLPSPVRRVLVVRPCCLGDVLLTTATIRAVAQAWPGVHLDYLVRDAAAAGLANNPYVARAVIAPPGLAAVLRLAWQLRRDRYDAALVLDRAPLSSLVALVAGARVRAGLDSRWRGLGLTRRVVPRPGEHEAALAARVAGVLGVPVDDLRAEYHPSAAGHGRATALLPAAAPGPRVVVHPGGGVNAGMVMLAKRWPPECFATLVTRLAAAGATTVVAGAAGDREAVDALVAALPPGVTVVDLAGELDLDAHAALASRCDLYIGHDSGPTHLAAATGTPTVVIFGPTDPGVYAPPGDHVRVVWRGARLDSAIDLRRQRVDASAILAVTVDDVWQAVVDLAPALLSAATQPGRPA
jgi:heptosyltransferase-2/heptosyltransferase-3